jgi:chromate reductase, NAD(P)H dehydrogenase (quinone)
VQILLVSGSTRASSGNAAALRTVQAVAAEEIAADLYDGLAVLPAFNPDDDRDPLPPPVRDLRQRIAAADAILFCVPEYAGTLPGSLKNLLDWTVGGSEMTGKRAAWINVASGGRGGGAQEHLAMVLGYVGAVAVDAACIQLPVPRDAVQADGTIADPATRAALAEVLAALARSASGRPLLGAGWREQLGAVLGREHLRLGDEGSLLVGVERRRRLRPGGDGLADQGEELLLA